jgi:hypothetical protein
MVAASMADKSDMTVVVPVWALAYVMNHASFQDEGPGLEGWSSPKMEAACHALESALAAVPDEVHNQTQSTHPPEPAKPLPYVGVTAVTIGELIAALNGYATAGYRCVSTGYNGTIWWALIELNEPPIPRVLPDRDPDRVERG